MRLIAVLLIALFCSLICYAEPNAEYPVRWTKEVKIQKLRDIDRLLDEPVDLSQAGEGAELILTNEDGNKVKVTTCREYLHYKDQDYNAFTTYDITMESWFILRSGTLEFLKTAWPSKVSYISDFDFRHSKKIIKYLPASLVLSFHGVSEEDIKGSEKRPLMTLAPKIKGIIKDEYNLDLEYEDSYCYITLLAFGDYNHDGIEDMLLHVAHHYYMGSGRGYENVILTQKEKGGQWTVLD